jgi:hypothetical protein
LNLPGTAVFSSTSSGACRLAPVSDWRCRSPHARSAVCGSVRRCWCLALAALYDAMPMFTCSLMLQYLVSANVLGANVLVAVHRYSRCARDVSFSKRIPFQKNFALVPMGSLAVFRRGFLLACVSYHACAWYVEHAVGRGHGGENNAAAVVLFLP